LAGVTWDISLTALPPDIQPGTTKHRDPLGAVRAMDENLDALHRSYPGSGEPELLSIGEMAREFGTTPRALRFYEAKGLLAPQR
jgi:hypothetical protein